MAFLQHTWGGLDSGTSNSYGTISSTGQYPAGRSAYNSSNGAQTFPILVTSIGASIAAGGSTARSGTLTLGSAVSDAQSDIADVGSTSSISIKYFDVNDKIINVSGAIQNVTPFKWVGNTYSVYAGRDTSTSITTSYNGAVRDGRMGGGIRYYLVPAAPGAVTATTNTSVNNRIDLSWAAPDDGGTAITGYNVYRSTGATFLGSLIGTSTTTTFADTDASKVGGTQYFYHVTALNATTTAAGSTISSDISTNPSTGAYASIIPNKPTITATRSSTRSSTIDLSYSSSVATGSPAISGYDIYRNGTIIANNQTATTYSDNTITPGVTYSYTVIAKNSVGSSQTSDASTAAPATIPTPPTVTGVSKTGRSLTVSITENSNGYGLSILGYYAQYQSSTTLTGSYSDWTTPVQISSGSHTYTNLDPARFYRIRVYAASSIINNYLNARSYYPHDNISYTANFSEASAPIFIAAGGKRLRSSNEANPGTFQPSQTAKRYDGVAWIDISNAKRFDGTDWVDLE